MRASHSNFAFGAAVVIGMLTQSATAAVSYWDFNVFSRSTIGSQSQGYTSSFQGASGAVGNAYFSNFSAKSSAGSSPSLTHGFYGGGMIRINSGSVANGGVHVAGDVTLNSASIYGPVFSGGSINGSGGSVNGNASIYGTLQSGISVSGTLATGQAYKPMVDVADAADYFHNFGASAAAMKATTSYANNWGELVINAVGPLTVVNVATADFTNAWGVRVVGGGAVVVNVGGTSVSFASKTWTYQNGASNASTILNLNEATTLSISGGNSVNILAANAATTFSSGTINGNLIVGSLMGSGSVNWNSEGGFSGADYVPAPGGMAIFAVAAFIAVQRRRSPVIAVKPTGS